MTNDPLGVTARLETDSGTAAYVSLAKLGARTGADPARLPHTVKILLENMLRHVEAATEKGATVLAGGRRADRPGFFMEPTLIENSRELDAKELFGPITTLHRVSGFDEAVEVANSTPYGLTASI